MPEFTAKGKNKDSKEPTKKEKIKVILTVEEVLKSASDCFGYNMADYYAYIEHIKKTRHPDLFIAIRIAADYIEAYEPEKKPESLSEAERARLDNYLKELYNPEVIKPIDDIAALAPFYKIIQGKVTNKLTKMSRTNEQLTLYGDAILKEKDFTVTIKEYNKLENGIPTTMWYLFDCLTIKFTETHNKNIKLPLKEYAEMRGVTDIKNIRSQALKDMDVLKNISYECKEKIKGKWKYSGSISICGGTAFIKNGVIYFNFNDFFYNQLNSYKTMEYAKETLKINPKLCPHAYYFSRYIDENYRQNEGKERVNTITIPTLMSKAPALPSYDEVKSKDRAIYRRIIEPVITNLNVLPHIKYKLLDANNKVITDAKSLNYDEWLNCKISVDYSEWPEHKERIEGRKNHIEANKETEKKKQKKGGDGQQKGG